MVMDILHLFWIVPLCATVVLFSMALFMVNNGN